MLNRDTHTKLQLLFLFKLIHNYFGKFTWKSDLFIISILRDLQ